jgi:hypothetical protein
MYEDGVCCFAESYRDDFQGRSDRLGIGLCLIKLHSILAHARLVAQERPEIARVVVYMDWKGLAGRCLMWDRHSPVSAVPVADDRFSKIITLDWAEVRDDYFAALRKIALPFFDLFPMTGQADPATWFTRERIEQLFASLHAQLRLF